VLRHRLFGIGWVILALAIIAVAWYGYPLLQGRRETLAQFNNVQKVVDGFGGRMNAVDSKLQSWSADQQNMRDQMTKLGQRMAARVEKQGKQVQKSSAEMFRRMQEEINDQIKGMQTRLTRVESSSVTANERVADLQRELGQVRSEMAEQANELRAVRSEMRNDARNDQLQVASLKNGEERNRKDVGAIADKLALRRVDFEVTKHHERELAPGISLTLTGTDVSYRRVKGYLWVAEDRRAIWLRSQAAQEPIIFYGYKDGEKRELVITNVTKDSATGYLLLPKTANSTEVAAIR
jgi:peptidoglycan hydrolase CwlO-like protein